MNEEDIRKVFYDPKQGLTSIKKLYEKLKEKGATYKQIKEFVEKQKIGQVYSRASSKKESFPINADKDSYQGDITFLDKYKKINRGYIGILAFVEITNKKAYMYPIKNKSDREIFNKMKEFINEVKPRQIETDMGKEFVNTLIKQLLIDNNIKHIINEAYKHNFLAVINAFHRTIRRKIKRLFTMNKNKNWIDYYKDLLENYNNEYNESIKKAPSKMTIRDEILQRIKKSLKTRYLMGKFNFNIGDTVRVKKVKDYFSKEKKAYTGKTYTIIEKEKLHYIVKSKDGDIINVKPYEIRRVKEIDEEPVKKQLKKTSKQYAKEKKIEKIQRDLAPIIKEKRVTKPKKIIDYE